MNIKLEMFLLGALLLPVIVIILIVLFPLILFFGILSLITGKPLGRSFVKTASFQWKNPAAPKQDDDDVIDVEVIRSENAGEQHDISGRSLR